VEGKKQYQIKISNRIATLQNSDIVGVSTGLGKIYDDIS
jgi:hypothetical protein